MFAEAEDALEVAPPLPFDVARQVRVFQPYIQCMEIKLNGCAIQRHQITIPKKIAGMDGASGLKDRLHRTFKLIQSHSQVSSGGLDAEVRALRDGLTRSLGKPWGHVILRSDRTLFDQRVGELRKRVEQHKQSVTAQLEKELTKSRAQIIEHYLPLAKARPPARRSGQLSLLSTDDWLRQWMASVFDNDYPRLKNLSPAWSWRCT